MTDDEAEIQLRRFVRTSIRKIKKTERMTLGISMNKLGKSPPDFTELEIEEEVEELLPQVKDLLAANPSSLVVVEDEDEEKPMDAIELYASLEDAEQIDGAETKETIHVHDEQEERVVIVEDGEEAVDAADWYANLENPEQSNLFKTSEDSHDNQKAGAGHIDNCLN